jgi:cytochrome c-type biogenesis protein CcmH
MTLWLILTIMTSVAAVWLAVPLIRGAASPQRESAGDIEIYRDQLKEVERELRDGMIDPAQAGTARLEVKRRILAAGLQQPAAVPALSGRERSLVILGATAIIALGSAILYATIGSPDLATTRSVAGEGSLAALPPRHPPLEDFAVADRTSGSDGEMQTGLPTVEEMTRRLAARLARNPGDTEGWRTLGWSYLNIGRFDEAANAYAKAVELDPGNTEFRSGRIEALVGAANGVVTPEAKVAIGDVLKRDPGDPRARYFAGLASEQDGDKAAALATWRALLDDTRGDAHADASWASDLGRRVADLKRDMGVDGSAPAEGRGPVTGGLPRLSQPPGGSSVPRAAEKGQAPHDIQAAAAAPPADRTAMIRGMVDGLASRLERAPRDADGWIRLIRSRVVLGEGELAKQALARGLAAFAEDGPERGRIAAAAQELGVGE